MATGWAGDGAVQEQIDATIKDGIKRVRSQLPQVRDWNAAKNAMR